MAYSTQSAVSDGTLTLLNIGIEYLDRSEISVYFDSVPTTAWSWVGTTAAQISFSSPVPAGVVVLVKRTTNQNGLRHSFSNGAAFLAQALDEDLLQALHIAQEAKESNPVGDFFGPVNMHGNRIQNIGPAVDDSDALTLAQYKADNTAAFAAATAAAASAAAAGISADAAATSATAASAAVSTLAASGGAGQVGYTQGGAGAIARTVAARLKDRVSVIDFGADPTGATDSTSAIQTADTYCRSVGKQMYIPGGTYLVSQLVFYTGSNWCGDGRASTIIKQIIGANTDLLSGANSNANWGASTPTDIVNGAIISGLQLDGSWDAGAGNHFGSGLVYYGARPILTDLFITNCAEFGLRTEYVDSAAGGYDAFTMEGWLYNIRIDTVGNHGWLNNGPHDTIAVGVIVIDAGQNATNSADAFYFGEKSSGRNIAAHAWNRAASARHRYALNIRPGAQHEFTGGCHFEGAYAANVGLFSSKCIFDDSTRFYSAWNGTNVYLGLTATQNVIRGYLDAPGAGQPASIGIVLGGAAGDYIADNTIDVVASVQEAGNISFTAYNGGYNKIRMLCYNASAATINGTPAGTDDVDIRVHNSTGSVGINNRRQVKKITLAAGVGYDWVFSWPFASAPGATLSIFAPASNANEGVWFTYISTTGLGVYNNNTTSLSLTLVAEATD